MTGMWEGLTAVFLEAQRRQALQWLLNVQLYLAVAALTALSLFRPVTRWTRRDVTGMAHDYFYGVVHTLVRFPLITFYLLWLHNLADAYCPWVHVNALSHLPRPLQVVVALLVNDFLAYCSHYLRHKVRPLWYFHTIHHSQERLNPFTTKRTHVVEDLFTKGVIRWLPLAVLGSPAEVWVAYYTVDAVWDYLIHSNLKTGLGPLRYVLVTPQYHRVHHSRLPQHFDKNFGDRFVIWDVLFGTAYWKFDEYPPTGVCDRRFCRETSLRPWSMLTTYVRQWCYPFQRIYWDLVQPAEAAPEPAHAVASGGRP